MEGFILFTREEFESFKTSLIEDLKSLLSEHQSKPKEYLRTHEVLEFLGISNSTLANYRAKGLIKPFKVEGTKYYRRTDLVKMIEQD